MVQFSINWTLTDIKVSGVKTNQYISELKLNYEWTMICFWKKTSDLVPYSVGFRRESTSGDVTISGSLSLKHLHSCRGVQSLEPIFHQKLSKSMESGSSSIEIYFNDNTISFLGNAVYNLQGDVNISSVVTLPNVDCRNCVHLKPLVEISNDLGRLLEPETCYPSDVNLKCDDASIPAHKIILSTRSPVFAAMFKNTMKENLKNEVVIEDMDASVLRIMLSYLYTGKLSDLTVSSASDLLVAADKYQLGELKKICCAFLKDNLSPQNVLRILLLGDLYSSDLKSFAMDYICNACYQFSVLEETEEWRAMRKEKPDLAMDILTSIVKVKENK